MKQFFRSELVLQALANIFSAWLRLCYATLRWTSDGEDRARQVWSGDKGAILCVWHSSIPLAPQCWPQGPDKQDMRVLISRSADGEFIARTMQMIGFPSIRGSSKKASDVSKNKHGEQAFRDMIKWVKGGGGIAITPDGPRGPAQVMQPGTPSLARITGAPVILCGMASKPCLRIDSWDKTVIPLPFARAAMVWDGPFHAGRDDDLEALALDWAARLTAATERAQSIVDGADRG
ncbi:MAG: lysophospholipid acyltransferase family protein [Caulobacter sp.]|nr:lysophospholipid acyltransferase family protein [Caulobacter sp.]